MTRIVGSRSKTAAGIAAFSIFLAVTFLPLDLFVELPFLRWIFVGLFLMGLVISLKNLVRPPQLLLEKDGFRIIGIEFMPDFVRWRDVEQFRVFHSPKGGNGVGYMLRPTAKLDYANWITRIVGVDGNLGNGWSEHSAEEVVALLESHRVRAQSSTI